MARVGWGDTGWPSQGHSYMYSPPGVAAPSHLINKDLGSGAIYDRGRLAPPEGRTLSLVPSSFGHAPMQARPGQVGGGDDGPVGYGDGPDDPPDPGTLTGIDTSLPPVGDATPDQLPGATGGQVAGPPAPSGTTDAWDTSKYTITAPMLENGRHVQYALDQNTNIAVGYASVDGVGFGPTQQAAAKAAASPSTKPSSASQQRAASEWINKSTLPNKTEIGQDPQTHEWFYRTPQGQVGKWDATQGKPAGGGDQGAAPKAGGDYGAPVLTAIRSVTNDPHVQLAMGVGAAMEGGLGSSFNAGDSGQSWGPFQINHNQGMHSDIDRSGSEDPAKAAQYMLKSYQDAVAQVPAEMWASDPKGAAARAAFLAERPAQMYPQNRVDAAYDQVTGSNGWAGGPSAPTPPAGPTPGGAEGSHPDGSYPVEYTDASGQTHVHWVTPDRTHYGTDDKGQYSYDPNTGKKTYISSAGPSQNVLSAGDSLVSIGGTAESPTAKPIFRAPPTYSSDTFSGGLYNFNPQTGQHQLEKQGPFNVGDQLFVPQDMTGQFGASNLPAGLRSGSNQLASEVGLPGLGDDSDGNPFYQTIGFGDDPNSDPAAMDPSDFASLGQGNGASEPPGPPVPPAAVEGMGSKPGEMGLLGQPHQGIDVQAQKGTPVMAPVTGTIHIEHHATGGLVVYVVAKDGKRFKMAHLDGTTVREGQQVQKGQPIATVGESGTAVTGPNLHFEAQNPDGSQRNPAEALGGMANMPPSPNTVGQGADGGFGQTRMPPGQMPQQQRQGPPSASLSNVGWGSDVGYGATGDYGQGQTPAASEPALPPGSTGAPGYTYVPPTMGTANPLGTNGPGQPNNSTAANAPGQLGYGVLSQQQQFEDALQQQQLQADINNSLGFFGSQPTLNAENAAGQFGGPNNPFGNQPTLAGGQALGSFMGQPTLDSESLFGWSGQTYNTPMGTMTGADILTMPAAQQQAFINWAAGVSGQPAGPTGTPSQLSTSTQAALANIMKVPGVIGQKMPTVQEQQMYQNQLQSALNNPWLSALTGMAPGMGLGTNPAYGQQSYHGQEFGGTPNGPNPIVGQVTGAPTVGGGDDRVGWGEAPQVSDLTPLDLGDNDISPGGTTTSDATLVREGGPQQGFESTPGYRGTLLRSTPDRNGSFYGQLPKPLFEGLAREPLRNYDGPFVPPNSNNAEAAQMPGTTQPGGFSPLPAQQGGGGFSALPPMPMAGGFSGAPMQRGPLITPNMGPQGGNVFGTGDDRRGRVGWGDAQTIATNAMTPLTGGTMATPTTTPASAAASSGTTGFGVQAPAGGGAASPSPSLGFEQPMQAAFSSAASPTPASTGGSTNSGSLTGNSIAQPDLGMNMVDIPSGLNVNERPTAGVSWNAGDLIYTDGNGYMFIQQPTPAGADWAPTGQKSPFPPASFNTATAAGNATPAQGPATVPWQTWQNMSPFQQAAWLTQNMAFGYNQPQVMQAEQSALASGGTTAPPDVSQMTYGTLSPLQQQSYGNTANVFGQTPQQWLQQQQRNWGAGQAAPVSGAIGWS